ncbi:MAG: DNA alkylation repair protein [Flavobacteriia bacterium]|nr:DNA alkylation repair protein [Flavobacteriia bacterium]
MQNTDLINELVITLQQHADENRAINAAKYMKEKFSFIGVDANTRKRIQKEWFIILKKEKKNIDRWEIIRELWEKEFRELHYVAIDWMNSWKKEELIEDDIIHLQWLITNNSWWDSVDAIASNILGIYFQKFPKQIAILENEWRYDSNMWVNRSCLIFQLKYKEKVNFEFIKSLTIQYQSNKEFFIQKAIGWSLRQYSKFHPEAVRDFLEEIDLKGLAKREAIKYI